MDILDACQVGPIVHNNNNKKKNNNNNINTSKIIFSDMHNPIVNSDDRSPQIPFE